MNERANENENVWKRSVWKRKFIDICKSVDSDRVGDLPRFYLINQCRILCGGIIIASL